MNKQSKRDMRFIVPTVIAIISVLLNIYFILTRTNPGNENKTLNNEEMIVEEKKDNETNTQEEDKKEETISTEEVNKEPEKEYIYKYIEGKEKEVVVEKHILDPTTSTDAIVTYIDAEGNTKTIELPSGTTINFSAGEHGTYDTVPASITLTDNQELDITDSSYNPSKVEVNYIFKGLSYSGNTMKCEYSLASNVVNVNSMQIAKPIKKGETLYIQLDYLESNGTQCINTNITLPNDCVLDIDIQFTSTSIMNLIGNVGGDKRADFGVLNGKWFCYMGNDYFGDIKNADTNRHSFKMDYVNKTFSMDNTILKTFSSVQGTISPYHLFARLDTSSISPYALCKLFSWKITQNDVCKYDLIPVERASDGISGMLDRQNGTFYTNSGSGEFIRPDINLLSGINAGKVMASGSYESGSALVLTAVPKDGYKFVKWLDNNSPIATRTITVGSSIAYTALFVPNN